MKSKILPHRSNRLNLVQLKGRRVDAELHFDCRTDLPQQSNPMQALPSKVKLYQASFRHASVLVKSNEIKQGEGVIRSAEEFERSASREAGMSLDSILSCVCARDVTSNLVYNL